jgi:DNA-binding transcriptional ArsR family regulator
VSDGLADWHPQEPDAKTRERVRALLGSPRELHRFAVSTLTTLWRDHLRTPYAEREAELREATSVFAALPISTHPVDLVAELVGRPVPGLADTLADAERLLLVPLPFLGPYVVSRDVGAARVVAFDASRALRIQRGLDADVDLATLKVLADETRLRIVRFLAGGERFGGDIVTHLGIAQPGVSRHLRLMTASGLLSVRQDGVAKYYALRGEAFDALSRRIQNLGRSAPPKGAPAP